MSSATPCMRKLFALVLAAGLLPVPAAALAEGGPNGHRGHGGHHGVSRHHGLGHAGFSLHHGVRRHHGLGHRGFSGHSVRRYHGLGYGLAYLGGPYYGSYGRPYAYPSYGYSRDSAVESRRRSSRGASVARAREPASTYGRSSVSSSDRAWALLSEGEAEAARSAFASLAAASPSHRQPKAGYALAAAILGDHEKALWAMRRAFRIDADSLHYLPVDKRLRERMQALLEQYGYQESQPEGKVDALFMRAALHYLLQEHAAAAADIDVAIAAGDTHRSARALKALLATRQTKDASEASPTP